MILWVGISRVGLISINNFLLKRDKTKNIFFNINIVMGKSSENETEKPKLSKYKKNFITAG